MGNMNSALVNRWGLNIFWYNFWYSTKAYNLKVHQNRLINVLLKIYLKFGINNLKSFYTNPYWFNFKTFSKSEKYFRWGIISKTTEELPRQYRFRLESESFFKSKVILLRYNYWMIVIIQWYKPIKGKTFKKQTSNTKVLENFYFNFKEKKLKINRFRTVVNYFFSKKLIYGLTYKF